MDGLLYLATFLGGALVMFLLSTYYNEKIMEVMREMMPREPRRKRKAEIEDGEEK